MHDIAPPVPVSQRWTHDLALNAVLAKLAAQADRLAEVKARAQKIREHR